MRGPEKTYRANGLYPGKLSPGPRVEHGATSEESGRVSFTCHPEFSSPLRQGFGGQAGSILRFTNTQPVCPKSFYSIKNSQTTFLVSFLLI